MISHLSVYKISRLSVYKISRLSVCLFIWSPICLFIRSPICPSVCLLDLPSVWRSPVCPSSCFLTLETPIDPERPLAQCFSGFLSKLDAGQGTTLWVAVNVNIPSRQRIGRSEHRDRGWSPGNRLCRWSVDMNKPGNSELLAALICVLQLYFWDIHSLYYVLITAFYQSLVA